jgi:uncharacterized membrane protein
MTGSYVALLAVVTLVLSGFMSGLFLGTLIFTTPVIRSLPPKYSVQAEQRLTRRYAVAGPILTTVVPLLSIAYALLATGGKSAFAWGSVGANVSALVSTLIFNLPINSQTKNWDPENLPNNWEQVRNKWQVFHAIRSSLFFLGFVLFGVAMIN